ncbi:unnamed protein product, partial [Pylaiella littoralis]
EVFVAHLVDHGAAVVIQKWWRKLPWRMRRLRMIYKELLGSRAIVIQRAYRRRLLRLPSKISRKAIVVRGGKAAAAFSSALRGNGSSIMSRSNEALTRLSAIAPTPNTGELLARTTRITAKGIGLGL